MRLPLWALSIFLYLLDRVPLQNVFVHVENVVDHRVNSVENWVTHCCRRLSDYAERFQVSSVRVMDQRNSDVHKIVEVAVKLSIQAVVARFDQITENVDSILLRQWN
jgi:hypothetical protein